MKRAVQKIKFKIKKLVKEEEATEKAMHEPENQHDWDDWMRLQGKIAGLEEALNIILESK